ncbi:MAG: hypothetical protein N4A46_11625 [Schleiferiaceae bacterium]|nr:hypothetical protein [Schleiferiaceae bacterium]
MKGSLVISFFLISLSAFSQKLTIGPSTTFQVIGGGSSSTKLVCEGDIQVDGMLDLDADAIVELTGDLTRNNSSSDAITEGNSTIIFNGTSAQEFTSTTTLPVSETFYHLTINNPSGVTINNTKIDNLNVRGVLDPQSGTFTTNNLLTLFSDSPTEYSRVAYGSGTVTGNVTAQKSLTNTDAGWRQISFPVVATQATANWSGISILRNDHSTASEINAQRWDGTSSGNGDYGEGWIYLDPADDWLIPANVFIDGTSATFNAQAKFSVQGVLNEVTNQTFILENTRDPKDLSIPDDDSKGWNHIPNFWPSMVDVTTLLNDVDFDPSYKAIHVWDAVNGNYRAILKTGVSQKVDWNTDGADIVDEGANIPPFQSYWVKANTDGQSIVLKASDMKSTVQKSEEDERFMKKSPDVARLTMVTQDSSWQQVVVHFDDEASSNFDLAYDGYYLRSQADGVPNFYGIEENKRTAIVARNKFISDSIPVHFVPFEKEEQLYIHMNTHQLTEDYILYLLDKKEKSLYEIDNVSIPVISSPSDREDRFVIYYGLTKTAVKSIIPKGVGEYKAYMSNNSLYIRSNGLEGKVELSVFDIQGRLFHESTEILRFGETLEIPIHTSWKNGIAHINLNGKISTVRIY